MTDSKNDVAWKKIFDKHLILKTLESSNYFAISSSNINEFREARLMTKFDHKSQLPELFKENNLSILPVSRGGYIIGRIETFHNFNHDDVEINRRQFPSFLESLNYRDITSESTVMNCAFIAGIIQDFTEEETLYSTVNGRMSSLSFDFNIKTNEGFLAVNVDNSQIEIDGGYEGNESLSIIEAKNYISDDFLVRQLFYPYKLWTQKIEKRVRSIFLTYTNGIFHFREYAFTDDNYYNSLQLIKQKKYAVQDSVINTEIIQQILNETRLVSEPKVPFPQADSFERVINLCELLRQRGALSKEEITQNYDFDTRQTGYYTSAVEYLGLLESRKENNISMQYLTKKGEKLFNISIFDRQIEFAKLILSHSAFHSSLRLYFKKGSPPSKEEVIKIMRSLELYNVKSDSTYKRRSATVISWVNWIVSLRNDW
jgi:hypothetical protein